MLTEAEKCLRDQLTHLQMYGWNYLRKGRVLECSLADILLRKGSYREAEGIYQKLKDFIHNHRRSRTTDLSYFRYLVGLAMASHLDGRLGQAYSRWSQVHENISQRG